MFHVEHPHQRSRQTRCSTWNIPTSPPPAISANYIKIETCGNEGQVFAWNTRRFPLNCPAMPKPLRPRTAIGSVCKILLISHYCYIIVYWRIGYFWLSTAFVAPPTSFLRSPTAGQIRIPDLYLDGFLYYPVGLYWTMLDTRVGRSGCALRRTVRYPRQSPGA
jgi:hypothetical protein